MSPQAIRKLLSDFEWAGGTAVLAVDGATDLAPELRQQFLRGRAEPDAVRLGRPEGAAAYVHVFAGEPTDADVTALRRARLARVPAIAVVQGPRTEATTPYVLATDVVWSAAGGPFPLETIARVLAARLGEQVRRSPPVCRCSADLSASTSSSRSRAGTASLPLLSARTCRCWR